MRLLMKLFLSLFLFCGCAHLPPTPARVDESRVELKTVFQGAPLEGALVYFYPQTLSGMATKPAYTSPFTGADGKALLTVKSGSYYLVALRKKNPHHYLRAEVDDYYCFYGGNPVFFAPGESTPIGLNAQLVKPITAVPMLPQAVGLNSGIRGQVTFQGKPLKNAELYLYLDASTHFRGPGSLDLMNLGEEGRFNLELPPGQYFLVAKKRGSGDWAGPLRQGDYFGYLPQNPLTVKEGEFLEVELECIEKTKQRSRQTVKQIEAGVTAVTGVLRDQQGKPLKGAFAFAYENQTMNGQRPPYISLPTAADGRYVLDFPGAGRYFLGARNTTGGPPLPGELYGEYEGSASHAVELQEGQVLQRVDIILRVME